VSVRTLPLLAVVSIALVLCGAAAGAAAPKPDAHDRAIALQLAAKVATFRAIAAKEKGSSSDQSLNKCAYLKAHPKDAFAAVFAILPALLVQLVNDYKPQLVDLENTVTSLHPDSPVFSKWLTASGKNFGLILKFDNHGQKIDLCQVATVMLTKSSTADDFHRVLGIDPALIGVLFSNANAAASKTVTKLNPQVRAFLIAAGVPRKDAIALTNSNS
jgi:hypothetical protein